MVNYEYSRQSATQALKPDLKPMAPIIFPPPTSGEMEEVPPTVEQIVKARRRRKHINTLMGVLIFMLMVSPVIWGLLK
jgi:hypothetical protein